METTLEILLEMQHIDQRLKELADPGENAKLDALGLSLDPANKSKLEELWQKRAAQLDQAILDRYLGLKERYGEAVVPLDGGTCLGCFMAVPTSEVQRIREKPSVYLCPACGKILYWVD